MKLKVKLLHPSAKLPTKARSGDAAFDLYATEDGSVDPFSTRSIPLGIATEFPEGYTAVVCDRSSLARKGITTLAGVIDSGYRGEWAVVLHNLTASTFYFKAGDRIAQAILLHVPGFEVQEVPELVESVRGVGGFGSSGR